MTVVNVAGVRLLQFGRAKSAGAGGNDAAELPGGLHPPEAAQRPQHSHPASAGPRL